MSARAGADGSIPTAIRRMTCATPPPASPVESASYTVQARSLVVLFALGTDETLGAVRAVIAPRRRIAMTSEADASIACWTRQKRSS